MKLLNREPTEEMHRAAVKHYESEEYTGYCSTFKALYDASPEIKIGTEPVAWQVIAKNGRTTGPTVRDMDELKSLHTCVYDPEIDILRALYSAEQLATSQAENERLKAAESMRDEEITALREKHGNALLENDKLTAERDELFVVIQTAYRYSNPGSTVHGVLHNIVLREALAKYEGEKHE